MLNRIGHLIKQVLVLLWLDFFLLEKLLTRLVGLVFDVGFIHGLDDYTIGYSLSSGKAAAVVFNYPRNICGAELVVLSSPKRYHDRMVQVV